MASPPRPAGWVVIGESDTVCRLRHPHLPARMVVEVRRTATGCDPRGIAARVAADLLARRPAASVEFRGWGHFGAREVALQVVGEADSIQLQAVAGTGTELDPLLLVVVATSRSHADVVGAAFADAITELTAEFTARSAGEALP